MNYDIINCEFVMHTFYNMLLVVMVPFSEDACTCQIMHPDFLSI